MSDELVSFDETRWSERCVQMAADAAKASGVAHEQYIHLFSEQVDQEVAKLPATMRLKAIAQAERWDYASATRRAIAHLNNEKGRSK